MVPLATEQQPSPQPECLFGCSPLSQHRCAGSRRNRMPAFWAAHLELKENGTYLRHNRLGLDGRLHGRELARVDAEPRDLRSDLELGLEAALNGKDGSEPGAGCQLARPQCCA